MCKTHKPNVLIKIESSYNTTKKLNQTFGDSKYDSLIKRTNPSPKYNMKNHHTQNHEPKKTCITH